MDTPKHLTVKEVAEALAVDHKTVRRLIREGKLVAVKIAGAIRIPEDGLMDYLERAKIRKPSVAKPTARRTKKIGEVKDYFA